MELQALDYVRDTKGGATLVAFLEHHERHGLLLWKNLRVHNLVALDGECRIRLTAAGRAHLAADA